MADCHKIAYFTENRIATARRVSGFRFPHFLGSLLNESDFKNHFRLFQARRVVWCKNLEASGFFQDYVAVPSCKLQWKICSCKAKSEPIEVLISGKLVQDYPLFQNSEENKAKENFRHFSILISREICDFVTICQRCFFPS